mgnify:CR=1 FL=1
MTGQLSALAQGKAAGTTGYTSKLLKTGQTTQYDSELDDGYYEVGVAKSYTVNTSGAQSGTTNVDFTVLTSDTGAFVASTKRYNDTGKCGVFAITGGETAIITGSVSNNGTFTLVEASADSMRFSQTVVDEADAPSITIVKRYAYSNNTVTDNNTGLEWTRYRYPYGLSYNYNIWTGSTFNSIFAICTACNSASVGGHNDWRIPNCFEWLTLIDLSTNLPDPTAFPSFGSQPVWLATTNKATTTAAYYWTSGNNIYSGAKTNLALGVKIPLLVRGGTA